VSRYDGVDPTPGDACGVSNGLRSMRRIADSRMTSVHEEIHNDRIITSLTRGNVLHERKDPSAIALRFPLVRKSKAGAASYSNYLRGQT
ncbi:MAG TPA: hypothetical protein VL069_15750, partial [Opitutus sp.]|nr:hypothetical protein [Opitutus sp.]